MPSKHAFRNFPKFELRGLLLGWMLICVFVGAVFESAHEGTLMTRAVINAVTLLFVCGFGDLLVHYSNAVGAQEVLATLQLAVRRGIPVGDALSRIAEMAPRSSRRVTRGLQMTWADTGSLADAMDRFPLYFPPESRTIVRAGERHQVLAALLPRLGAEHPSRPAAYRVLIVSVMYPGILACLLLLYSKVTGPSIARMSEVMGEPFHSLPAALGEGIAWTIIGVFVLIGIGPFLRRVDRRGRLGWVALRIPILRRIAWGDAAGRWADAAGLLLESGLTLPQAHAAALEAEPLSAIRTALAPAGAALEEGASLSAALERAAVPEPWKGRLERAAGSADPAAALRRAAVTMRDDAGRLRLRVARSFYPIALLFLGATIGLILGDIMLGIRAIEGSVTPGGPR